MELQHLRTLVAVAEAASLTRAAKRLHVTQPAVSAQVKALEEHLGLTLFRRTGRGVVLTHAGEQLLPHAREILTRTDGLRRRAAELSGDLGGVIRLGWIDCGYDLKVAQLVGQARQRFPELRVELATATSGENVRSILDQELDIAFLEGEWDDPRLRQWRLGASRVGIIAPTAWRQELSEGGWPRLTEFPWVFQGPECSYSILMSRLCREHRIAIQPEFRSEDFGAVKHIVAEGLALSIADLDSVSPWIDSGRIFVWNEQEYEMPVSLAVLKQREDEPNLATFVEIARRAHGRSRRRQAGTATPSRP
jgi:DNA-binding transcriptional LysR family regulator